MKRFVTLVSILSLLGLAACKDDKKADTTETPAASKPVTESAAPAPTPVDEAPAADEAAADEAAADEAAADEAAADEAAADPAAADPAAADEAAADTDEVNE